MRQITKEQIIETVCEVCGIRPEDLDRRTREGNIVMARHFIAYYMFHSLNRPIREIAQTVGVSINALYGPLFHYSIKDRAVSHALTRERYNAIQKRLFDPDKSFH